MGKRPDTVRHCCTARIQIGLIEDNTERYLVASQLLFEKLNKFSPESR